MLCEHVQNGKCQENTASSHSRGVVEVSVQRVSPCVSVTPENEGPLILTASGLAALVKAGTWMSPGRPPEDSRQDPCLSSAAASMRPRGETVLLDRPPTSDDCPNMSSSLSLSSYILGSFDLLLVSNELSSTATFLSMPSSCPNPW